VIGAFGSGIRNAANPMSTPKIMAPMRGLRLSSKMDEIVVAIAPATRVAIWHSAEIIAIRVSPD
jgi:hypothetical protein